MQPKCFHRPIFLLIKSVLNSVCASKNFTSCVIYKRKHINDLFKKTLKGDDDAEIDNL